MNWEFFGRNGVRLYHYVGGDGAGFLAYLFSGEDIGEPAPTRIMWVQKPGFLLNTSLSPLD